MPDFPRTVDLVFYAVPIAVTIILLDILYNRTRHPARYESRDSFNSLLFGLGSNLSNTLTGPLAFASALYLYEIRIHTLPITWWVFLLCFVLDDLAYYASHVAAHRVRWFWASHANHHSSQHFNFTTSFRHSWTRFFTFSFAFRIPLVLVGFHPALVFFCGGLNLVYNFWIHTETIRRLPRWIEAVFNTPSHHRVHHAVNPQYLDSNYAGVLIIWDKLFGTFVAEDDSERIRFGIVKQLGTFNLLWGVFHEWVEMGRDFARAPLRYKLAYVLGPPGWRHDGPRDTTRAIRERWAQARAQRDEEEPGRETRRDGSVGHRPAVRGDRPAWTFSTGPG